jgi:hypothetical protein
MAQEWEGKSYDTDWFEIDAMGNRTGGKKDWGANAGAAASGMAGVANPYTNKPGSSPWDTSGQIPENEPGSTMAKGTATGGTAPTTPTAPDPNAWAGWSTGGTTSSGGTTHSGGYTGPVSGGTPGYGVSGFQPQVNMAGGAGMSMQMPPPQGGLMAAEYENSQAGQAGFPSVSGSQLDAPALLAQLGQTPTVAAAGPLSGLGQTTQGSIQNDLTRGDAVDINDPVYRAQVEAFNRNQQRSADRTRAAMAQRANATGTLGSGGFESQVMRGLQNQGEQEANFEAQLMGSELANNRARTARAQQMGAGLLSQEQQQSLTERLANQSGALQGMGWNNQRDLSNQGAQMQTGLANQAALDRAALANQQAALASRGMGYQEQRGINDDLLRRNALGLQGELGRGDLDLRRLGLTQQDAQYYAGLGQQLGLANRGFDQDAMLALLRGGG